MASTISLMHTQYCHLCEQALELIRYYAPEYTLKLVDIALNDELMEAYGVRIPVVVMGGNELNWPFDGDQLKAFIAAN
ncbi:glutaredoxin family protein [uncultured Umboniibacter sp.]|uniref:glutaredoxin family protein n=1 Tax=uncultured Umboniibacter sp. TaxID=1798917 RepID=UPI0026257399|nr:glutaredoxin family protein [uncultured Umboniibacter sp.]